MIRVCLILFLALFGAVAHAWEEPARGTDTRKALMDAIRPFAEWQLGAPVQFVVHDLRRAGDVAFAALSAQRPGGAAIDLFQTPAVQRGEEDGSFDITEIHVLYKKSGNTWVAVHRSFGATDAWWSWGPLCAEFRAVTPDACRGVE